MRLFVGGEVFVRQRIGGVSRIYLEVIPRIARLNPDINMTLPVQGNVRPEIKEVLARWYKSIPFIPASWRPWRFWNRVSPAVNGLLSNVFWRAQSPDVFLSSYFTSPPLACPKICVVYDLIAEQFGSFFEPEWTKAELQRKEYAIRNADLLICISQSTLNDLLRIYGVDKRRRRVVRLAGFSYEKSDLTGLHDQKQEPDHLLYVGEYRLRYKNFEFMLRALADDASLNGKDLVVVSYSSPTSDEFRSFTDMAGGRSIRFETDCDDEKLKALYSSCEAFVYPSLYEGFGIPVLEALSCGAPVVCSSTSSFPEVGGDAVYYFDPRSADEFGKAIKRALADGRAPDKVAQRKQQAGKFSWDKTAEGFLEAIRSAKRGGRG